MNNEVKKNSISGNSYSDGVSFYLNGTEIRALYKDGIPDNYLRSYTYKVGFKRFILLASLSSLGFSLLFINYILYPNYKIFIALAFPIVVIVAGIAMRFSEVSKYHGAEHKAINAHDHGKEITYDNVRLESRVADCCGVDLVMLYMIYCMPISLLLNPSYYNSFVIIISCIIITWILRYGNKSRVFMLIPSNYVGRLYQKHLSTREPDEKHIILALYGINKLIESNI